VSFHSSAYSQVQGYDNMDFLEMTEAI